MKAKVVKTFRDKHTRKVHKKGHEVEITNERFEEINSTAHGCFLEEIPEEVTHTEGDQLPADDAGTQETNSDKEVSNQQPQEPETVTEGDQLPADNAGTQATYSAPEVPEKKPQEPKPIPAKKKQ